MQTALRKWHHRGRHFSISFEGLSSVSKVAGCIHYLIHSKLKAALPTIVAGPSSEIGKLLKWFLHKILSKKYLDNKQGRNILSASSPSVNTTPITESNISGAEDPRAIKVKFAICNG